MKRVVCIAMGMLAVLVTASGLWAGKLSGNDILNKADAAGKTNSSKMYIQQTIKTPSGQTRTFKMLSYSQNGQEKGLTEYLSPAQIKGMKILSLNDGDDIWSYFPRTNRVRKIASSARNRKVQGSDFTYEDMASGTMEKNWSATLTGEEAVNGKKCYKLTMTPTASGPKGYQKAVAWVNKADFTAVQVVYYNKYGEKEKQLSIGQYKKIKGVLIPHKYTMKSLMDGGITTMTVAKAYVNVKLDDALFSEAGLGK